MAGRGRGEEDCTGRGGGGEQPGRGERKKKDQKDGLWRERGKSQGRQAAPSTSLPCSLAHCHTHAGLGRGQGPACSQVDQWVCLALGGGRPMCGWHQGLTSHYLLGLRPPLLSPLSSMATMTPTSQGACEDGDGTGLVQSGDSASYSLVSFCDPHTYPGRWQARSRPHFMGGESSGVAGMVCGCGGEV